MGIVIAGVFHLGALFVDDQRVSNGHFFGRYFLGLVPPAVSAF